MISRSPESDLDSGFVVMSITNSETGEDIAHLPERNLISIPDVDEEIALREVTVGGDDSDPELDDVQTYRVEDRKHVYSLAQPAEDVSDEANEEDILYTTVHLFVTPIDFDVEE